MLCRPASGDAPAALRRDWSSGATTGEPVAYITGRRAFWNIELHVGPACSIPRPDSEVLIASAIEHFEGTDGPKRILDLGTGPGHAAARGARPVAGRRPGMGVDRSRQALAYAAANARRLGFEERAELPPRRLGQGDQRAVRPDPVQPALCRTTAPNLARALREYEPDEALFAGRGRARCLSRACPATAATDRPGGLAAVEIGHDQAEPLTPIPGARRACRSVADDLGRTAPRGAC